MNDIEILAVTRIQRIYRGHYTRSRRDDIEDLCLFRKRIRGEIRNCETNCFKGSKVSLPINNRSHLKRFEEWKHQAASKIQKAFKEFLLERNALNKRIESKNKIQLKAAIKIQCFARKILAKRRTLSLRESRKILARCLGARLVQSAFRSLLARRKMAKRRYQLQSLAACVIQSSYRSHAAIAFVKVIKEKTIARKRFNGAIALQCLIRQRIAYSRVDSLATCRLLHSLAVYSSTIQALVRGFLVRLKHYKIRLIEQTRGKFNGKVLEVDRVTGFEKSAVILRLDIDMGEDNSSVLRQGPETPATPSTMDSLRTRIVRRPTLALVVSALTTAILSSAPLTNVLNVLTLIVDVELEDCFNKVDEGSGVTALQLACQRGLVDVVRLLLKSSSSSGNGNGSGNGSGKKTQAEAISEVVVSAMHKACRPTNPASQALPMIYLLLGIEEESDGSWSLIRTEQVSHSPSSCYQSTRADSTDLSSHSDGGEGPGSMVNTSLGVANTVIGNHTEKLKYSRTSRMKKHVLKMAQALSLCGSDGRNCILYAALSGQTLVLDFAMRVMSEARHIREVVNSRAVEAMKAEVVLTSSEKTATILAAEQTEDAAALIAEAALSADLDAAAASNIVSASKTSDASPLSSKVTRDRAPPMTARGVATPLRNLYQGSPLTAGTDEGRHSGAKGKQHLTTAEELRSDSSSDDELPETPPPPVVEVERVWSRRTSLRYKQLTTEKMQKDLIEKKRVAAEETARINVCLFPDVLEVSTSFVEWCEDDATSSVALAMSGNTRCLSHLLDSSFDPYTVSTGGVTLAMVAAKEGQCNVLDLLMEREIDLSRRDDCDKNVFHYAATCAKWNVISFLLTHAKSKQCLLHEGGLMMQDADGCTPLHTACRAGVDLLLDQISSEAVAKAAKMRNKEGLTPLLVACSVNGVTAIRSCLALGSDASALDYNGHSAIWHLCHQSSSIPQEYHMADGMETAVCLLKAGCPLFTAPFVPTDARVSHRAHMSLADPGSEWCNVALKEGSAAFFKGIATHLSSQDSWRAVLSSIGCRTEEGVLMFRALMAGGAAVRMMLEPQVDITTPEGRNIMRILDPYREPLPAILSAPVESHRTVSERRPSLIDLTGSSFGGFTVGGWAVRLGGVQVVEHLLSCGYNPTQPADIFGNSMVHLAAKYGTEGMVDAVCTPRRYVLHLEAPNTYGFTAAMEGARSGNVKGVKRLVSYGASAQRALDGGYSAWLLSLVAAQNTVKRTVRDEDVSQPVYSTDGSAGERSLKNIKSVKSKFLVHNTFDLDILRRRTRLLLSSSTAALLAVE